MSPVPAQPLAGASLVPQRLFEVEERASGIVARLRLAPGDKLQVTRRTDVPTFVRAHVGTYARRHEAACPLSPHSLSQVRPLSPNALSRSKSGRAETNLARCARSIKRKPRFPLDTSPSFPEEARFEGNDLPLKLPFAVRFRSQNGKERASGIEPP